MPHCVTTFAVSPYQLKGVSKEKPGTPIHWTSFDLENNMTWSNNRSFKSKPLNNIQQTQFSIGWRFCPVCGHKLYQKNESCSGSISIKSVSYTHLDVYKRQVGSVAEQGTVPVRNDSRFSFRCPCHPLLGVIYKFRFQILQMCIRDRRNTSPQWKYPHCGPRTIRRTPSAA